MNKELIIFVIVYLALIGWMENVSGAQDTQPTMKVKKNVCADNHIC